MLTSLLLASFLTVSGTVSRQDGKGIADIPVSNGDTIVMTDRKGRYTLPVIEDMSVFPVLDGNWEVAGSSKLGNKAFPYYEAEAAHNGKQKNGGRYDFTLIPVTPVKDFTINVIGDVQVGDLQELDYASRALWPELMADTTATFNLWLGDLVNNNLSLYPRLGRMMEMLPMESWTMNGNHDRDVDSVRTRQTATFARNFGAPVYAFTKGNVTFIVLNNVYGDGARSYRGKIDDRQLRFVRNVLKFIPEERQIVITAHIPIAETSNREALLSLLKGRGDVLALTGHLHAVSRNFLHGENVTVHELVGGAACGFWWVGERDWDGVPSALMQCGTPKGYFRMKFTPDNYDFSYKPTSQDHSRQANIWIAGTDTIQRHIPAIKDLERGEILVTVYGGCDSTRVEAKIDGTLSLTGEKVKIMDPNVARIREMNIHKDYPTKHSRRNPFRRSASPQIWRVRLPEEFTSGTHRIDITATDRFGLRCRASRMFSFPD